MYKDLGIPVTSVLDRFRSFPLQSYRLYANNEIVNFKRQRHCDLFGFHNKEN
jgi:hypothetical protein